MSNFRNQDFALFTEALAEPPDKRKALLDSACKDDAALRARVEALLQANDDPANFLGDSHNASHAGASLSPGPQPGDRIGRYLLGEPIGEGGCGIVFAAEQEQPIRRSVALKVIKPGLDTKSVITRFESERQALALMEHPNIAQVLDAGTTGFGRPFFVMELVRGMKITDYCDQNSLTTGARLELFIEVCHAIQHAHQKGIIHRDIKPSNILVLTTAEGKSVPKVIDFGVAKAINGQSLTEKTLFTAFEVLIGTPAYMSPEQAAFSTTNVDTRTDVYSLGVLLFELLTSTTPFDVRELFKSGLDEIRRVILSEDAIRPSTRLRTMQLSNLTTVAQRRQVEAPMLIRSVSGDLDWIVLKALEKDRTRRYDSANDLAVDVQRFLANEPISARPPGKLYKLRKLVLRNKLLFAAIGVIVAVLLTGLAFVSASLADERLAHQEAEHARNQAESDKRQAQAESARSQQMTYFLRDMLDSISPTVALGRDTTLLREVLKRTDARITTELPDQPSVEADLRFSMGTVYENIGAFSQAGEMFRRVLELRRSYLPENHSEIAVTLTRIGRALSHEGKLKEAIPPTQAAMAIWLKLGLEESLDAATTVETLARLRWKEGNLTQAEALIRRTHALRRNFLPEDSTEVLNALNSLGTVLLTGRRYSEAEQLYRQILDAKQKRFGNEHPSVADGLFNLGTCLANQGKTAEAKEFLSRSVVMRRKLLGQDHPHYTASLENLAGVLRRSGNYAEAEKLYREMMTLVRKRYSNDHPAARHVARYLAGTLVAQSKNKDAESLLNDYLSAEFANTPESASMLNMRAEALARLGRWREAAADAARALRHQPDDHQHYHTLAPLLIASNDLDAYAKLCREIVNRFAGTTDMFVADRMAKDCLIHPSSAVDFRSVAALADLAVTSGNETRALSFRQLCKALAEYRQGHFTDAEEWAAKAGVSSFAYSAAESFAVLAMAKHQLKEPEAARDYLAKAATIVENQFPKIDSGDLGSDWRDWIIAHALLKEARLLVEGGATLKHELAQPQ